MATVEVDGRLCAEEEAHRYALAVNGLFQTRTTTPQPHATLHGLFLGPLHVTFGTVSPRMTRRTKLLYDRDRFDGIALQWVRSGAWHGQIDGRPAGGRAGTMAIFDFSQPFSIVDEGERDFAIVMLPRALAMRLAEDPATLHGRTIDAGEGAVLAGFLGGLIARPDALRANQGAALAEMLVELIALALRADDEPAMPANVDPRQWLRDRVERLVAMRLGAADLTPDWIARKLGLSRTDLYAAFPGEGVSRMIRDRRAAAAQALLSDPDEQRPIMAIAQACGFVSKAHFSRVIKQCCGMTPSALRAAVRR